MSATLAEESPAWISLEEARFREALTNSTALDEGAEIKRLAEMPMLAYEREREHAAERLKCRVAVLDILVEAERAKNAPPYEDAAQGRSLDLPEPESWPQPVDGADLLDETAAAIRRHVVIDDAPLAAVALWCVAVHAFESFDIFPRLFLSAPTKGAGKSTLLDTIALFVPRPLEASSASAAALFRVISAMRPVLLLDEADLWVRDNEDVRMVLNAGHKRGGTVLRCVGEEYEPRAFDVFAAAALAAIGQLPDTIEDRSIVAALRRKRPDEVVTPIRAGVPTLERLARKAARWASDHAVVLSESDPTMPAGIANRMADNWAPLLAVADAAGGDWPTRARQAATTLTGTGEDQNRAVMLLADIRQVFEGDPELDRISSEALAARLVELEHRPWPEYRNGRPITNAQLARALSRFGIVSQTIRLSEGGTAKGYYRTRFDDAFTRYLPVNPPAETVTPSQPVEDKDFSRFSERHNGAASRPCDVSGTGNKPNSDGHCAAVTVQSPTRELAEADL